MTTTVFFTCFVMYLHGSACPSVFLCCMCVCIHARMRECVLSSVRACLHLCIMLHVQLQVTLLHVALNKLAC